MVATAPTLYAPNVVTLSTSSAPATLFTATAKCIVEVVMANIDGTNDSYGTVSWVDSSNSNAVGRITYQQKAAAGDGFVTSQKTLDTGDSIQAYASAANTIAASVNVLYSEA